MLKEWSKGTKPDGEELERRLDEARAQLAARQTVIKEKRLPILVILEGWGAAGKGSVLGRVIRNMDPRFFKVDVGKEPTEDEQRRPFLYRHFVKIPETGKFAFLVGSWMKEVTRDFVQGELDEKEYNNRLASIKCFERQLTDNGYLVLKFFFHIDEKEQKKR